MYAAKNCACQLAGASVVKSHGIKFEVRSVSWVVSIPLSATTVTRPNLRRIAALFFAADKSAAVACETKRIVE